MRILALETSGSSGSVAALDEGRLIVERPLAAGSRSAQSLAPGIDSLLAEVGWLVGGVDLVAVTQGPGSFTGLRIGVTTAKALAYAGETQVIGVNTLEVIARQAAAPRSDDRAARSGRLLTPSAESCLPPGLPPEASTGTICRSKSRPSIAVRGSPGWRPERKSPARA